MIRISRWGRPDPGSAPQPAMLVGAALLASALFVSACTLERRPDPDALVLPDSLLVEGPEGAGRVSVMAPDPDASVQVTLEVFREAVRVGDLSLALQLLDTRALLLDDLVAGGIAGVEGAREEAEGEGAVGRVPEGATGRWGGLPGAADQPATRGELLLELRRRHAAGLGVTVVGSQLRWMEDDLAVLTSRLALTRRRSASDPGGETPPDTIGWARETAIVRATSEGWRILHLHRSIEGTGAATGIPDAR